MFVVECVLYVLLSSCLHVIAMCSTGFFLGYVVSCCTQQYIIVVLITSQEEVACVG